MSRSRQAELEMSNSQRLSSISRKFGQLQKLVDRYFHNSLNSSRFIWLGHQPESCLDLLLYGSSNFEQRLSNRTLNYVGEGFFTRFHFQFTFILTSITYYVRFTLGTC